MIIIGGIVIFETEDHESLFEHIRKMMADSQAEEGCIAYEFSRDLSRPDVLHLYEVWESPQALKAHGESAHMATFREQVFPSIVHIDTVRYEAQPIE